MSDPRPADRPTDALPRPAGWTFGPYRILDTLGRGGMGVVYRAKHESGGEVVALKTVTVPHERLLGNIRREIHALARVRHPGIVRVVAEGVQNGVPWYAMELCKGQTVKPYLDRLAKGLGEPTSSPTETADRRSGWWTTVLLPPGAGAGETAEATPAPPSDARPKLSEARLLAVATLVGRVCRPLGYMHGEGIVHRDLKPDNILVLEDGSPVLVDFGLMSSFGGASSRDALEVSGETAGTTAYMAPEQIRGELPDARADLYALGCILYDLLAGRPPFVGDSAGAVLGQHLHAVPLPLSERVAGVPGPLAELVERLLQKQPRDRVGYADDVAAALGKLGLFEDRSRGPRARAYLYRPGICGRGDVLREIEGLVQGLAGRQGGLVFVGGESGVGKTRLASEVARVAMRHGCYVLTGECAPRTGGEGSGPAPLQGLRGVLQALADRCRDRGPEETGRIIGRRRSVLQLYEPALAALPGAGAAPDEAGLPPAEAKLRLHAYLSEVLAAIAERERVVVILDDLHAADDLLLGFIELLARGGLLRGLPVLLFGTFRAEEADDRLRSLVGSEGVHRVMLGRLGERDVAEMTAEMLALPSPPREFVDFLARQSEGNPFFVAEYLRTAVWEEILVRDDEGRWRVQESDGGPGSGLFEAFPLPGSIRDLVARRLDGLAPGARKLLEVASVMGREIDQTVVVGVSGLPEDEAFEAIQTLVARQVLEEMDGSRCRFAHDKLREAAYQGVSGYRRRRLHQAVAEAMERTPENRTGETATLGRHWECAGRPEKASACYLAAAREAWERHAHDEAARLYRSFLGLAGEPSPETATARVDLAAVLATLGRSYEAIDELRQAAEEAKDLEDGGIEGRAMEALAALYHVTGKIDEAMRLHESALEIARTRGDARAEAAVLEGLGNLRQDLGQISEARDHYGQALHLHRASGDRLREGAVLVNLGNAALRQGRIDEAKQSYEGATRLAEDLGLRRLESQALGNLATLYHGQGRMDEAVRCYERSLALARELGLRRVEGVTLGNLGICRHQEGRADEARDLYQRALAMAREAGDVASEGSTLFYLATLELELGRIAEAEALGERALVIHRRIRDRRYEAICLGLLGNVLRYRREMDRAGEVLGQAAGILRDVGDTMELAKCLCQQGHLELCRGGDGGAELREAEGLAEGLGVGAESELGGMVARLRRACDARGRGEALVCGEVAEEMTAGVRGWVEGERK